MKPGSCILEGMRNSAAYLDPIDATCCTGNTLDWYMVSGGLAIAAETTVIKDTQIFSHYPVQLRIGGALSEDLGNRIRRPNVFAGMTKQEVKDFEFPEGDFKTKSGTLNDNWNRWNDESELYLCHKEDKRGK